MLPNLSTLSVGAVLAASVLGSALPRSEPRVLGATVQKVDTRDVNAPQGLRRRAPGTVNVPIQNAQGNLLYLLNATVGTPGQTLQLQLDTGSSDIWVRDYKTYITKSGTRANSEYSYHTVDLQYAREEVDARMDHTTTPNRARIHLTRPIRSRSLMSTVLKLEETTSRTPLGSPMPR